MSSTSTISISKDDKKEEQKGGTEEEDDKGMNGTWQDGHWGGGGKKKCKMKQNKAKCVDSDEVDDDGIDT